MSIQKDDLLIAADWLDAYEDQPGGDVAPRMKAVAEMLRRTSDEELVRTLAKRAKVPVAEARLFLRRKGELAAAPEGGQQAGA